MTTSSIPDQQSREEIMGIIIDALNRFGDMEMLANRTGLSKGCLQNIRRGKTAWPRWTTLETIMIPLKIRLTARQY